VDTADLAELLPGLMDRYPGHRWTILSAGGTGVDLSFEVRPTVAPDRAATVKVLAGAEVYVMSFQGHTDADFAYNDEDRLEALEGRIELAAAATQGPTQVILEFAGDSVVGSRLLIGSAGLTAQAEAFHSWPLRRLKAHLFHRQITQRIIDLPGVGSDRT
jgi:hypothetical protein